MVSPPGQSVAHAKKGWPSGIYTCEQGMKGSFSEKPEKSMKNLSRYPSKMLSATCTLFFFGQNKGPGHTRVCVSKAV